MSEYKRIAFPSAFVPNPRRRRFFQSAQEEESLFRSFHLMRRWKVRAKDKPGTKKNRLSPILAGADPTRIPASSSSLQEMAELYNIITEYRKMILKQCFFLKKLKKILHIAVFCVILHLGIQNKYSVYVKLSLWTGNMKSGDRILLLMLEDVKESHTEWHFLLYKKKQKASL